MSRVFTELVTMGMSEESAGEIVESLNIHNAYVTKDYLDAKLFEVETRIHRDMWIVFGTMTGMFGIFIGLMTWALKG